MSNVRMLRYSMSLKLRNEAEDKVRELLSKKQRNKEIRQFRYQVTRFPVIPAFPLKE